MGLLKTALNYFKSRFEPVLHQLTIFHCTYVQYILPIDVFPYLALVSAQRLETYKSDVSLLTPDAERSVPMTSFLVPRFNPGRDDPAVIS